MDTFTLECFLAVAQSGSFTKAAKQVKRSQSAVTQQIHKLESELGKSLFNRKKNSKLTEDGELFLSYATKIYELHREALDRFKAPELVGKISFGAPEDFVAVFLSDVLVEFSRLHPRILLNVECDLTLNLFSRFKANEFDIVLVKMCQQDDLLKDLPSGVTLFEEKLEWVGRGELASSLNKNMTIPLIMSPTPCVYRAKAISALEKAGLNWRVVFSSPSYAGKMAAVEAGIGITVLPKTMIPPNLQALKSRFLPSLEAIHINLLKKQTKNEAITSLEQFLLKKLHMTQ